MPKVLVVDDSLSVRKVVEKALAVRSVQVLSAASGAEALQCIERDRPDLVVCDVILPDKDGYQICEFVRAHPTLGKTPVLLMSGIVNSTVLARAAEVKSNDVMFKPFAAEELVRKIDGLLAARGGLPLKEAAPQDGAPSVTARPAAAPPAAVRPPAPKVAAPAARAVPAEPPRPAAAASSSGGLRTILQALAATPGVRFAALTDREGFLIESAGEIALEVEVASALASCLAESSEGIGRELGQGALTGIILEYEKGMMLLQGVGVSALLAVMLGDPAGLGKVRYFIKKSLPELQRAL